MADQYSKLRQEWLELAPYWIKNPGKVEMLPVRVCLTRICFLFVEMLPVCGSWTAAVVKGGSAGCLLSGERSMC